MPPISRTAAWQKIHFKACPGMVCPISETHNCSLQARTQFYQDFPHALVGEQSRLKLSSQSASIAQQARRHISERSIWLKCLRSQEWPHDASTICKIRKARSPHKPNTRRLIASTFSVLVQIMSSPHTLVGEL